MKKSMRIRLSYLLCLSFLIPFQNCSKDNIEEVEIDQIADIQITPVVEKLLEMGYSIETIVDLNEFYLVGGDLMFSKNIEDYTNNNERQFSSTNLVSNLNVTSMTVFIDASIPTIGDDNWRVEIGQAINDWNGIENSCINFVLSTNPSSDIVVRSDNNTLPDRVIAAAWFPSGGQPHDTILINLDFFGNWTVGSGQKRYNMVHELGHCIGFRHSNWQAQGEGEFPVGADLIPGTPATDANSVMNGGTALFTWNGFSNFDEVAAVFLYDCTQESFLIGDDLVCGTSISSYTLDSTSTAVNWSTSTNLQIISSTSTSVTVQPINVFVNGDAFIEAQLMDGTTARKDIWIGAPTSNQLDILSSSGYDISVGNVYEISAHYANYDFNLHGSYTYEWNIPNSQIISTSSNGSRINFIPLTTGTYPYKVRAVNACGTGPWITRFFQVNTEPGDDDDYISPFE